MVAERFRREAIAVARLNHPNIVAVYDAIEDDGPPPGRRDAAGQRQEPAPVARRAEAPQPRSHHAHRRLRRRRRSTARTSANLVHRDVKPGNILITPDGRVLLTDFGIAKGLAGTADDDLTSDNIMMGTAKYLSPEQVRGRKLDGRADLYSLGLVLYECLAGRVPFLGETDADTALARLNRDPTDLTRLRPTLPLGLAPLIHRLLARRPDDRYATGADVRAELQRIAAQPRIDHDAQPRRHPRRHRTGDTPHRAREHPVAAAPPAAPRSTRTGPTAACGAGGPRQPPAVSGHQPAAVRPSRRCRRPRRPDRHLPPSARVSSRTASSSSATDPSMVVVGGLLLAAFVVGLVLWVTMGTDEQQRSLRAAPRVPGDAAHRAAGASPSATRQHRRVHSLRPRRQRRDENDDLAAAGHRRQPGHRVAHGLLQRQVPRRQGRRRAGRRPRRQRHRHRSRSTSAARPTSCGSTPRPTAHEPATFAGWGAPIDSFNGTERATVAATVATPARCVLVSFIELGTQQRLRQEPVPRRHRELTVRPDLACSEPARRPALVAAAQAGDRAALDQLVRAALRPRRSRSAGASPATRPTPPTPPRRRSSPSSAGSTASTAASAFSTWVYRIATNASLDELRRRRRRPLTAVHDDDRRPRTSSPTPTPGIASTRSADRDAIEAALLALPEDFRVPVVLRDVADLDYAEIAGHPRRPVGTVKSRIARGRGMLAAALDDHGTREPGPRTRDVQPRHHERRRQLSPELELASAYLDGDVDEAQTRPGRGVARPDGPGRLVPPGQGRARRRPRRRDAAARDTAVAAALAEFDAAARRTGRRSRRSGRRTVERRVRSQRRHAGRA